jgi:hypothetical protein
MNSYKANNKNELYYIFAYVVLIVGAAALSKKPVTALYAGGIFIPLALLYIFFLTRLNEILVDKKKGTLTAIYRSHFRRKKERVFKIANLEWGYKRDDTLKVDDHKALCILYDSGEEVLKIKSEKDGWKSDTLYNLVVDLQKMGVKRKFTGYVMKDTQL